MSDAPHPQPRSRSPSRVDEPTARQAAGPQEARPLAGEIDHGALKADRARATVEDECYGLAEIGGHVLRRGRADPAGWIGARCGYRCGDRVEQSLGDGVRRHPDGHGAEPGRRSGRDTSARQAGQYEGEGAGPEGAGYGLRALIEGAEKPAALVSATCRISGLWAGRPLAL